MKRSLAIVLALSSVAAAKPKLLVLGIEPQAPPDKLVSVNATALDLTDALREQTVVGGASPYELVPLKETLSEAKTLNDCLDEAPACMAAIGQDAKADVVEYGHLAIAADGQLALDLTMVDVATKTARPTKKLTVPRGPVNAHIFDPAAEPGTLHVAGTGTIEVNGRPVGQAPADVKLAAGPAHVVVGSFTTDVTITSGQTTSVEVPAPTPKVEPKATPPPDNPFTPPPKAVVEKRSGGAFRVIFWGSAAVAAAGIAGTIAFGLAEKSDEKDVESAIRAWGNAYQRDGVQYPGDLCREAAHDKYQPMIDACNRMQHDATLANIAIGVGAAGVVASAIFLYEGFIASHHTREVVVLPTAGGAMVFGRF